MPRNGQIFILFAASFGHMLGLGLIDSLHSAHSVFALLPAALDNRKFLVIFPLALALGVTSRPLLAALLAGSISCAFNHFVTLQKAKDMKLNLKMGQEWIFRAGELTPFGLERLLLTHAMQIALLIAVMLLVFRIARWIWRPDSAAAS